MRSSLPVSVVLLNTRDTNPQVPISCKVSDSSVGSHPRPTFWASVGISSLDELSSLSFRESSLMDGPPRMPARLLPTEKGFFPCSSSEDRPLSLRFPASSLSFLLSFSSSFWTGWVDFCWKTESLFQRDDHRDGLLSEPGRHFTSSAGVIFSSRRLSRFSIANMRLLSSFIC